MLSHAPGQGWGIHRGLARLERWDCANLRRFNKAKGKVLHLGWDNPKHKQTGDEQMESSPEEKDLGEKNIKNPNKTIPKSVYSV